VKFMDQCSKNRTKAFILLIVFSLNTVVGFACSVGINMGYNAGHHKHGSSHSHKSGSSHKKGHSHNSGHKHSHHHHEGAGHAQDKQNSKDDCCANDVTKFIQLDKSVVNAPQLNAPHFLQGFISTYTQLFQIAPNLSVNSRFQFVRRSCFLNDTDIRISIQSFQI
jgi:hypothetical protein